MRRRSAETLIEFLTALLVFLVVMTSIFTFMANQTENIARLIDRDFFVFNAQKWLNERKTSGTLTTIEGRTITFTRDNNNLVLRDNENASSMTFQVSFDI
ncbi:MAG: hypothetical protein IJT21_02545 [Synergistaceae bacterium]|nr:hypothetical protein [Synergistaceae bacterium]